MIAHNQNCAAIYFTYAKLCYRVVFWVKNEEKPNMRGFYIKRKCDECVEKKQ